MQVQMKKWKIAHLFEWKKQIMKKALLISQVWKCPKKAR